MEEETNENGQRQGAEQQQSAQPNKGATSLADQAHVLAGTDTDAADPRDAEIARLKHRIESEFAEQGRVRKANEQIAHLNEEIARLKAENAKLSMRRPGDYLDDKDREKIDAEQLAVIDKLVQGRMGDASAAVKAENERLRDEMARRDASAVEMRKAQFDAEVERMAPGLVAAISDGHIDEWNRWRAERRRASSVNDAFKTFDAATAADFIMEFAEAKGIRAGADGVAARPQTSYSLRGGSRPAPRQGDTATYTVEQYSEALRRAGDDFNAGRITADEYRAVKKKFDTALSEGRIVPR